MVKSAVFGVVCTWIAIFQVTTVCPLPKGWSRDDPHRAFLIIGRATISDVLTAFDGTVALLDASLNCMSKLRDDLSAGSCGALPGRLGRASLPVACRGQRFDNVVDWKVRSRRAMARCRGSGVGCLPTPDFRAVAVCWIRGLMPSPVVLLRRS